MKKTVPNKLIEYLLYIPLNYKGLNQSGNIYPISLYF